MNELNCILDSMYMIFIDYEKAFDFIQREFMYVNLIEQHWHANENKSQSDVAATATPNAS